MSEISPETCAEVRARFHLVAEQYRHPNMLKLDELKPKMFVRRHFLIMGEWAFLDYQILDDAEPWSPEGYFLGGEKTLMVRENHMGTKVFDRLTLSKLSREPMKASLATWGLVPYNTVEGPMWAPTTYCTVGESF